MLVVVVVVVLGESEVFVWDKLLDRSKCVKTFTSGREDVTGVGVELMVVEGVVVGLMMTVVVVVVMVLGESEVFV